MKVKEMIALLSKQNLEAEVYHYDNYQGEPGNNITFQTAKEFFPDTHEYEKIKDDDVITILDWPNSPLT